MTQPPRDPARHRESAQPRDLQEWRRVQRTALLERRVQVDPEERSRASAAVCSRLLPFLLASSPSSLALYWPIRGELDLRPLADDLARSGVQLGLPVVAARGTPLVFRIWHPGAALEPRVFGIAVPVDPTTLSPEVVLVPLVGFDRERHRLGYGGGYYDRTLAAASPRPLTVGVGWSWAELDTVHPQPWDVALDRILTERGWLDESSEDGAER